MVLYKPLWQWGISFLQSNLFFNAKITSKHVLRNFLSLHSQVLLPKHALFPINKQFKSTETPKKPKKPPNSIKPPLKIEKSLESEIKKHRIRVYSPEDDKFIKEQIELNGDNKTTHRLIAKVLGVSDARTIANRYKHHLSGKKVIKGQFSSEEDKIILDHINEHGRNDQALQKLAEILNRSCSESIRQRHKRLTSKNDCETTSSKKAWKLEEDEKILCHIIKLKKIKANDIDALEKITSNDFSDLAQTLNRTNSSCYTHWMHAILPALKSHILRIPLDSAWKLKFMSYIVKNKIKHERDIDIDYLLINIIPDQTRFSVLVFEKSLRDTSTGKNRKTPLHEIVENKFAEQSECNPCFNKNHKGEKRRIKRANDVIFLYNMFVS